MFRLRKGVWVDREYDEEKMAARKRTIEAFPEEYFALLRESPELLTYLAFSDRRLVVVGGRVFEITPPRDEVEEKEKTEETEKAEEND